MPPSPIRRLRARADAVVAAARSSEERERQRRERFWRQAGRYVSAMVVEDRHGNAILVATSDAAIGREVFLERGLDSANTDAVLALLRERGHRPEQIVDVGANIGTVTLELLSAYPDAHAVAFEPDRANARLLRQNVIGNDLGDRVRVVEAAVSDHDGEATFEISPVNPGDHRVRLGKASGRLGEERWATRTVPVVHLDGLVERGELDPSRPTLIWVDAQGHEAQILAGARTLRHVPIVVEFWPYGLRRAGGYDAFLREVAAYDRVLEVRGGVRPVRADDLAALGRRLEAAGGFSDLLLLPAG
jgi:FkbM family methyltransferase